MSIEPYPIIEVQPAWVLEDEQMGNKRKFWYRSAEQECDWLFKYPKPGTGMHWSEKIAAEVASLMIRYANVPMSLADACLVRMSELYPNSAVLTADSDFNIYRRHTRQIIPVLMPTS